MVVYLWSTSTYVVERSRARRKDSGRGSLVNAAGIIMGEISRGAAKAGGKEADRSKKFVCRTEDKIIWVKNVANRVSGRRHTSCLQGGKISKALSRDSFMGSVPIQWITDIMASNRKHSWMILFYPESCRQARIFPVQCHYMSISDIYCNGIRSRLRSRLRSQTSKRRQE